MGVVQLPLRTWEDKMHRTISLEEVKRKLTTLFCHQEFEAVIAAVGRGSYTSF